jgi:predicted kinase
MQKMIICQGLPASGKSTWAINKCKEDKSFVRVNRDDLRTMRGEYWVPAQEKLITTWQHSMITNALIDGYNVIVDDTNLNPKTLDALRGVAARFVPEINVEIKFFDVDVEECIKRDRKRERSVGEKVIRDFYNKYLAPSKVEYIENPILPPAIIVDIDGTLAKMNGRGPYDWDKVGTDKANTPVVRLVQTLRDAGRHIILVSGRDGSCYDRTVEWLRENKIPYLMLLMREAGNNEDDRIVKKRMFEQHIRGKYYVNFVLDDRDKVVRMWREELGLTCLQVDYGNF